MPGTADAPGAGEHGQNITLEVIFSLCCLFTEMLKRLLVLWCFFFFKDYISTSYLQHEPRQFLKTGFSLLYLLPLWTQSNQDSEAKRDEWAEDRRWNGTLTLQTNKWVLKRHELIFRLVRPYLGGVLCAPLWASYFALIFKRTHARCRKFGK